MLGSVFIFLILFIFSCNKELDEDFTVSASSQDASTATIDDIKEKFIERNYDSNLYENFNDSVILYWEPSWKNVSRQSPGDSVTYSYVSLNPKLQYTKSEKKYKDYKTFGFKKYIVIKQTGFDYTFYLANYYFKNNADSLQKSLKSFTGNLLLKNLSDNTVGVISYENGIRKKDKASKSSSKLKEGASVVANAWNCVTYYDCVFTQVCMGTIYGTHTFNIGYCQEPARMDCGNNEWVLTDSYSQLACSETPDPPLPDTGEGGSSTGLTAFSELQVNN